MRENTISLRQIIRQIETSLSLASTTDLSDSERCVILTASLKSLRLALDDTARERSEARQKRREARRPSAEPTKTSNAGKRWSATDEALARQCWKDGFTLEKIAETLDRSLGAITLRLEMLSTTERLALYEENLKRGGKYGLVALENAAYAAQNAAKSSSEPI